ncbi:unnamed protein product [Kluyveromyces dobzhanskii CBS 2104]|uniref:WGS project CCBQ000000000 data, contig 00012 n=1 Tax=Kluyveromyces dobzhanskii CBS 2104 TaxID=1427455 RepID=A0A0A8L303_9SACH|nr:unnamed protein product [Kluyveromyces dobzhanskii CBS 2104]
MEKYSSWRDAGTGIPPFLPDKSLPGINPFNIVVKYIKYFIVSIVGMLLLPFIGSDGLYQLKLGSLFSIESDVQVDGVKKRHISMDEHFPKPGCLYVVNALSPFDALVLRTLVDPKSKCNFILPREDSLYTIALEDWFQFALEGGLWSDNDIKLVKINDLETSCSGKVNFLFAEGTTSNGKSVLPFEIPPKLLQDTIDACGSEVKSISLKLNGKMPTPLEPRSVFKYKQGCISQGVRYKVRISENVRKPDTKKLRINLVGGDEYKLVGKKLDFRSKLRFSQVFYN